MHVVLRESGDENSKVTINKQKLFLLSLFLLFNRVLKIPVAYCALKTYGIFILDIYLYERQKTVREGGSEGERQNE